MCLQYQDDGARHVRIRLVTAANLPAPRWRADVRSKKVPPSETLPVQTAGDGHADDWPTLRHDNAAKRSNHSQRAKPTGPGVEDNDRRSSLKSGCQWRESLRRRDRCPYGARARHDRRHHSSGRSRPADASIPRPRFTIIWSCSARPTVGSIACARRTEHWSGVFAARPRIA